MKSILLPSPLSRRVLAGILFVLCLAGGVSTLQPRAAAQTPAPTADPAKPAPGLIIFNNGDQLTGILVRAVGDSVVFKSDIAGEITVPLAKVKELRSSSKFAVLRKNEPITRTPRPVGSIQIEDGKLTLLNGTPETIPVKELAFIIDSPTYTQELEGHRSFLEGWNGAITAGASLVRSTQIGSSFTAGITAIRTIPTVSFLPRRNRTIFNLTESYGKLTQPVIPPTTPPTEDSVAKTNIFHTDVEQDQYFTPRFFALGTVSFDHNYSQGLDLQQVYGGGLGWTPIETPKQQLDFTATIHYEKQAFQLAASNQNLIGATIGQTYLRNLPAKLVLNESASFLPAFNNPDAYSANFAAGLALPVFHRLSISFTTTDSYLNNPSFGYKKNSYQFVTGVTYTLH